MKTEHVNTERFWGTDFFPVPVLGRIALSLYEVSRPQPSTEKKSCTHGSTNFIQYWGSSLQEGS